MAPAVISVEQLTKTYRMGQVDVHALRGIDMEIQEGEFVAVMGHSGSGKSTLMNILGCLDRPTSGRYMLQGEDVSTMDRNELAHIRNQQIGFVFQSFNLLSRTSSLKNVMLPMMYNSVHRRTKAERTERARDLLTQVGLEDRMMHGPQELSGGERQRVAIARALVNDPALLLADEPTGNLDTASGEEIMAIMHELHSRGVTIVMITHEPDIAAHTQRVIHLRDGEISSTVMNGYHTWANPEAAQVETPSEATEEELE